MKVKAKKPKRKISCLLMSERFVKNALQELNILIIMSLLAVIMYGFLMIV